MPAEVGAPEVALSATGDGIIVFDAYVQRSARDSGWVILASIYDPDTGLGGANAVSDDSSISNSSNTGYSQNAGSHVAIDASGRALVVWRHFDGSVDHGTYVSRAHDPATGWGPIEEIADTPEIVVDQYDHALAVDGAGNSLLVWPEVSNNGNRILASRRPAGGAWSAPQVIAESPPGYVDSRGDAAWPGYLSLAMNPAGTAVLAVAWSLGHFNGNEIWAQSFDPINGFGVAQRVTREGVATDSAYRHDLAIDAAGNALLVWTEFGRDGSPESLLARRYLAGSGWSPEISTLAIDVFLTSTDTPQIALDAVGNGLASYVNNRSELVAIPFRDNQWLLRHLVSVPDAILLNEEHFGRHRTAFQLAMAPEGDATLVFALNTPEELVVWDGYPRCTPRRIAYRRFHSSLFDAQVPGSGWQEHRFIVPPDTRQDNTLPVVAMAGRDSALASWVHNLDQTAWDECTLEIRNGEIRAMIWRAPTAEFSSTSDRLEVSFDATASHANTTDARLVRFQWDFEDDGTFDTEANNVSTTHRYPIDGTYTARLRVSDTDGVTAEATRQVVVSGGLSAMHTLAVRFANSGSGRVTSQPVGIDCSSTGGNNNCAQNFADGTVVQLVAEPAAGFRFEEWRGDADCVDGQLTMDATKGCEAVFVSNAASFVLQFDPANIIGAGGVETDDLQIVCPSGNCAATYLAGMLVRIRAVPAAGALLEAWTGACASFPAQTTIQFVMSSDVSCGAVFASAGP